MNHCALGRLPPPLPPPFAALWVEYEGSLQEGGGGKCALVGFFSAHNIKIVTCQMSHAIETGGKYEKAWSSCHKAIDENGRYTN